MSLHNSLSSYVNFFCALTRVNKLLSLVQMFYDIFVEVADFAYYLVIYDSL